MRRLLLSVTILLLATQLLAGKNKSTRPTKIVPTAELLKEWGVLAGTSLFDFYTSEGKAPKSYDMAEHDISTVTKITAQNHIQTDKRYISDLTNIAVLAGKRAGLAIGDKVCELDSDDEMTLKGFFFNLDFLICRNKGYSNHSFECKRVKEIYLAGTPVQQRPVSQFTDSNKAEDPARSGILDKFFGK